MKDGQINIEVLFIDGGAGMSITSNVSAHELFSREPLEMPFSERIILLDQLLEKLFVIQEGNAFHMKVEN